MKAAVFLAGMLVTFAVCPVCAKAQASASLPPAMTECEPEGCIVQLQFHAGQAEARWPNGALANLNIEKYDGQSITMRRTDTMGASAGLGGVYTGTRKNNDFAGTMTWSWPGHGQLSTGTLNWTATPWATADPVPVTAAIASKLEKSRAWMSQLGAIGYVRGSALLQFTVLPNGSVADIRTLKTTGASVLGDLPKDSLSKWTYNPYLVKGAPTAMRINILYTYDGHRGVKISYP